MLNPRSPVPLYYQLQEVIRARIEGGQWQAGQQLPPESEICQEFNLSRGTVRQALMDLVREGLLVRRRGKGSFVAQPKAAQDLMSIAENFSSYAQQVLGQELGVKLISTQETVANKAIAEKLEIPEGSEIFELLRVKYIAEKPFFMTTSYLPKYLCPNLEEKDYAVGSLFKVLRDKFNLPVTKVTCWFEPVVVTDFEASLLDIDKGAPAMLLERVRYTTGDRPMMASKHIIRGDLCRLTFQARITKGL